MSTSIVAFFSALLGWAYFLAWSISFYPQVILNWQRKSVQGLSLDFLWYNIYGFACYSVFNIGLFASEEIRKEYRDRNQGNENLVRANDIFFGLHALAISTFTLYQTYIYKRDRNQRLSIVAFSFICITLFGTGISFLGVLTGVNQWIDLLYYISSIKLAISFIKYLPQARLNYLRKSTVGWSIYNILLDFIGGILSLLQLVLDAYLSNNWRGILGDPLKLGLGFIAITFDLLFMFQHYVLYRNREDPQDESDRLVDDLDSSEESGDATTRHAYNKGKNV